MANTINVRDLAVTRGSAAFITCRFRRLASGKLVGFHFKEHFDRLIQSCEALGLHPCPRLFTFESLQGLIDTHDRFQQFELGDLGNKEVVVRVIVTAGESQDAVTTEKGRERFFVLQDFYKSPSTEPLKLKLIEGAHQAPEIKITGKYAIPKMYRDQARAEGFDDILFYSSYTFGADMSARICVSESFSANFFLVTEDEWLITPEGNVLHGTTRNIVFKLASESELFTGVVEYTGYQGLWLNDFQHKESFLTSTTRGVMPVARLQEGNGRYWDFKTGPDTLTAKLQKLYNDYVERYFSEEC